MVGAPARLTEISPTYEYSNSGEDGFASSTQQLSALMTPRRTIHLGKVLYTQTKCLATLQRVVLGAGILLVD